MSTYVVSMIEVRQDDEWKLLREFKRISAYRFDGITEFPKKDTWIMYNLENEKQVIEFIDNSCCFNDDYQFQDFLLDSDRNHGFIQSDLGMPKDAASLTIDSYKVYGNNASIPSYFTLKDLMGAWREMIKTFKEELSKAQKDSMFAEINYKLDILLSRGDGKEYKKPKNDKYEIDSYHFVGAFNEIISIHEEICRIKTLVKTQYGWVEPENIRIIWFIY